MKEPKPKFAHLHAKCELCGKMYEVKDMKYIGGHLLCKMCYHRVVSRAISEIKKEKKEREKHKYDTIKKI